MNLPESYKNIIYLTLIILLFVFLGNVIIPIVILSIFILFIIYNNQKNDKEEMQQIDNKEPIKQLSDQRPSIIVENICRRPTVDNPLMNRAATEFGSEGIIIPAACNANDEDIKDEIRVNFNHELFRDLEDVWERKNSQRQFYTMPNTAIPNNQTEFAKWLYELPMTANCKEFQGACLRYDPKLDRLKYPPR